MQALLLFPDDSSSKEMYINNSYTYPLLNDEVNSIFLKYKLDENVGVIEVYLGDELIHTEPILVRDKEVVKKSFIDKLKGWLFNDE